ncbi:hypothetical protein RFI_24958, partial [Reticulomyxa filosa]
KQEISNPETNRCMILKNVSTRKSPQEVVDTLEELGYEVEEVERFKGMPVVKVIFSNAKDVQRALQEKVITIGFNEAKCETFDKYRRRPRSHFIQCRKCFKLNHFAKDCKNSKICKYCGRRNHISEILTTFQMYVLCKGQHSSNSILCPVIQKTRNAIGVNLSRREKKFIEKKEQVKTNLSKNPKDFKENSKVPNYKEVIARPKNKNQVNEQVNNNRGRYS